MNPEEDDIEDKPTDEFVFPYRALDAGLTPAPGTCDRPPPGWFCSRDKGHAGPCAAWPR